MNKSVLITMAAVTTCAAAFNIGCIVGSKKVLGDVHRLFGKEVGHESD